MFENVSLFEGLSAEMLATIESRAVLQSYPRGAVVISEGNDAASVFVIVSGSIKVYCTEADGKETVLNTMEAGQHFGKLAEINNAPFSAAYVTMEPTRLLVLSNEVFKECLGESPEIAYQLIALLANRVQESTKTADRLHMAAVIAAKNRALLEEMERRRIEAARSGKKDPDT